MDQSNSYLIGKMERLTIIKLPPVSILIYELHPIPIKVSTKAF